jgi:hypothetical protein
VPSFKYVIARRFPMDLRVMLRKKPLILRGFQRRFGRLGYCFLPLERNSLELHMKERIAALCCLMLVQSSVVTAGEVTTTTSPSNAPAVQAATQGGPLLHASLSKETAKRFLLQTRWDGRQQPAPDDQDTRPWMERHPVWTGAMVGFAAGALLIYAVGASENHRDAVFTPVGPGGPALVFGGVGAGIGALAGWGIGRSHDDVRPDRTNSAASAKPRSR